LQTNCGVGGNGEAWLAEDDAGNVRVVKVLTRFGGDGYSRFRREVEKVQEVALGFAVLPIEEAHLPRRPRPTGKPHYVMPHAVAIADALRGRDVVEKVEAVRSLDARMIARTDSEPRTPDARSCNHLNDAIASCVA